MKILEFNKDIEKREHHHLEGKELYSILNKPKDEIVLYDLLTPEEGIEYRLRKASDNTLVAEFDKDLNIVGGLKCLVDAMELEKAFSKLKEGKLIEEEVNKLLGFDRIEEEFRNKGLL